MGHSRQEPARAGSAADDAADTHGLKGRWALGHAGLAMLLLASCGGGGGEGGGAPTVAAMPGSPPTSAASGSPHASPASSSTASAMATSTATFTASSTASLTASSAASPTAGPALPATDDPMLQEAAARAARRQQAFADESALRERFRLAAGWTGSTAACEPGDIAADYRAAILDSVNRYRRIAGLPAVTEDPQRAAGAQLAALMVRAERRLSHEPTPDWACYSQTGAQVAGRANLALGWAGPAAIRAYMADPGHADLGHRRWLLYARLQSVGIGDTGGSNALWVLDHPDPQPAAAAVRAGVAWPPAGFVADSDVVARPGEAWSFSLPDADFSGAQLSLRNDRGEPLAVIANALPAGMGDPAIGWTLASAPGSWQRAPADTRLLVRIQNVRVGVEIREFEYEVVFVTPPG